MNDASKWKSYDVAQHCLEVLIAHYSELVYQEERKSEPDAAKIQQWEAEQEAFIDQNAALSVEDQAANERIISTHGPTARAIMNK